jgi:hypothetical protein
MGCNLSAPTSRFYPDEGFTGVRKIAVLPVKNLSGASVDLDLFSNVLCNEISRFKGVDIIRPAVLRALVATDAIHTVDDIKNMSLSVNADAVLECVITDYDPFNPPRISLQSGLYRMKSRNVSKIDVDSLAKSATWKKKDFRPEMAGHIIVLLEHSIDTHRRETRADVEGFASLYREQDTPWQSGEQFLNVQERFWQFAANRLFNRMLKGE